MGSHRDKTGKFVPFLHRKRKIRSYIYPEMFCKDYVIGIRRRRRYVKKDGPPLPETPVSKVIGYTPNYVGYQPAKRIPVNTDFLSFLSKAKNLDPEIYGNILSDKREVWTGSYDSYSNVLKEFTNYAKPKHTSQDYLRILEEEGFPWLKLPVMPPLEKELLRKISVNPNAHPGFYTKLFFGDKRKDTLEYSLPIAEHIFDHLQTKRYKWQGLWTLGGRSKDIKLSKEETAVGTRAIWIPEEPLVLLSLIVVQPFTKLLQDIDQNCIFVGKNFNFSENQWFRRLDKFYEWNLRSDWKLFDAHVDSEMMLAAMNLIRKCYPDDRFHTRYFSFLTDTLVNKNLVIPPGFVYKISKGMPSGHPLVTLVNSLVNYICFIPILQKIVGKGRVKEYFYAVFSGDDSKIYFRWTPNMLYIDDIIRKNTTLVNDGVASSISPCYSLDNKENKVKFLKRYINDAGFISWHSPSMIRKLLYSDKNLTTAWHVNRWYCSLLCSAPGDAKLTQIIKSYIYFKNLKDNKNSKDKMRKDLRVFLADIDRAESVGFLTQAINKSQSDFTQKLSEEFVYEKDERKAITRFVSKSVNFQSRALSLMLGLLCSAGRRSFSAFDEMLVQVRRAFMFSKPQDIARLYDTHFFHKHKIDQISTFVARTRTVPTLVPSFRKVVTARKDQDILSLIADFCAEPRLCKLLFDTDAVAYDDNTPHIKQMVEVQDTS